MKDPASKLTRMRLDLEEFSFDIEYVKRKQNVGADALSRIEITSLDLKNMLVLPVQTRSITRTMTHTPVNESTATKIDHLKAYDSINNIDAFNLLKVVFDRKLDYFNIMINNKNLKGIIAQAQIFQIKGTIYFEECIQMINAMAKVINIKKIAIIVMDSIFNFISREKFKEVCNEILNDVIIVLYTPARVIKDEDEKQSLIEENHDTPSGGHVGINKLHRCPDFVTTT